MNTDKPYKPSPIRGLFAFSLFATFVPYLFLNREWKDAVMYSYICGLPFALRKALLEIRVYYKLKDRVLETKHMVRLGIPLLLFLLIWSIPMILFTATLVGIVAFGIDAAGWLADTLTDRKLSITIGVIATAVVGILLFILRLKLRCVYGCSELLVGLMVAGWRVNSEANPSLDTPFVLALLTAGAYLVVRGLDNIHQGLKAGDDPVVNFLIRAKEAAANWEPPPS